MQRPAFFGIGDDDLRCRQAFRVLLQALDAEKLGANRLLWLGENGRGWLGWLCHLLALILHSILRVLPEICAMHIPAGRVKQQSHAASAREWPQDTRVATLRGGILQDDARNRTINRGASGKARIRVMGVARRKCRDSPIYTRWESCLTSCVLPLELNQDRRDRKRAKKW